MLQNAMECCETPPMTIEHVGSFMSLHKKGEEERIQADTVGKSSEVRNGISETAEQRIFSCLTSLHELLAPDHNPYGAQAYTRRGFPERDIVGGLFVQIAQFLESVTDTKVREYLDEKRNELRAIDHKKPRERLENRTA